MNPETVHCLNPESPDQSSAWASVLLAGGPSAEVLREGPVCRVDVEAEACDPGGIEAAVTIAATLHDQGVTLMLHCCPATARELADCLLVAADRAEAMADPGRN